MVVRARRQVSSWFVFSLMVTLLASCGMGGPQSTKEPAGTSQEGQRTGGNGGATGTAHGGGGGVVRPDFPQHDPVESSNEVVVGKEVEEEDGKAVVFVDKTPRAEQPPSPRDASGADDGDSGRGGMVLEAAPEPEPVKREAPTSGRGDDRAEDKPREAKEEPRARKPKPKVKKTGDSQTRVAVKDTESTTVAVTADAEGDTAAADDTGDFFLAAHNLEVAEDWGSEFAPIAHTIGPVYTHPGGLPSFGVTRVGKLDAAEWAREHATEGVELELPLKHTHVDADLSGPIARVHVQQTFENPHDEVIEAVYTFPLPENSAVDGMKMVIGERVIEGVIMEREQARAVYEEAKAQGYTAALLEQERPNVFTQSVANIAPKVQIDIETRYVQDLTYDEGKYEFVFPMVVGPRYVPAGGQDEARINPPVLGRGERSGHDISVTVRADAGVAIHDWAVPTHDVDGNLDGSGRLTVRLSDKDKLPNRDFVLRYAVAGEEPQATVLSEQLDDGGYFTLMVQPPEADIDALVGTREVLFVVDVSGSMAGVPLAMSKELIEVSLSKLRPVDTFNILTFASGTVQLFESARPASRQNVELALGFVDKMESGGGTEMMNGVKSAMQAPIDAGMNRVVVFATDGYIGNEEQVLQAIGEGIASIEKKKATARVFAFGVGSSTNRYLIDGLAENGEGTAQYALTREDPQLAVDSFFNVIDKPIWTDVELDFGALAVDEESLYPSHVPDLFASHPLVVHGRYTKAGSGTVTLKARAGGKQIEIPLEVELSKKSAHKGVLGTLWARAAIGSLERDMLYSSEYTKLKSSITDLGLSHSIVTQFTSFVAVDRSAKVDGGGANTRTVDQPVERPEGVSRE